MKQTKKRLKLMSACLVISMILTQTVFVMAEELPVESSMTTQTEQSGETLPETTTVPETAATTVEETTATTVEETVATTAEETTATTVEETVATTAEETTATTVEETAATSVAVETTATTVEETAATSVAEETTATTVLETRAAEESAVEKTANFIETAGQYVKSDETLLVELIVSENVNVKPAYLWVGGDRTFVAVKSNFQIDKFTFNGIEALNDPDLLPLQAEAYADAVPVFVDGFELDLGGMADPAHWTIFNFSSDALALADKDVPFAIEASDPANNIKGRLSVPSTAPAPLDAAPLLKAAALPGVGVMAIPTGTQTYTPDEGTLALEVVLVGVSINNHSRPFRLWVQGGEILVAVKSTHLLKYMTIEGTTNLQMVEHPSFKKVGSLAGIIINIGDELGLDPRDGLQGNIDDAHWTIFSFPLSILDATGYYEFFIKGIGGGHDVGGEFMVIIPTAVANLTKTWVDGPMTPVDVQLYNRVLESHDPDIYSVWTEYGVPVTLTAVGGTASYTWPSLPVTDNIGRLYEYDISEADPGQGYTVDTDFLYSYDPATKTHSYTFTLKNTYNATPDDAIIQGQKELTGSILSDGQFSFRLYASNAAGDVASDAVPLDETTNQSGIFSFTITYNLGDEGTYYYVVREVAGSAGGFTYDTSDFLYRVDVSDNDSGAMEAVVTSPEDSTFNNSYEATGNFTPSVTKALSGRTLADGEFTFDLMEGAVLIESVSNLGTSIPFAAINYTLADVGEHTYTISEQASGLGGVTDDTLEVTYIVTVSDNGDGTLDVAYDTPEDTVFNNSYEATGNFTPSVTKALSGRTLADGEFTFDLMEGAVLIESVSNLGTSIPFAAINYTLADVGEHTYTISEQASGLGGVTDDTLEVTYIVTVSDNGDGTLDVAYDTPEDSTFNNSYEATGNFTPSVTKALSGRTLADGEFTFDLMEGAVLIESVSNLGTNIPFAAINYTLADVGEHTYTISEQASGLGGVTDDTLEVTYIVTVSDNGDGTLDVAYDTPEDTVFNNSYEATGNFTPSVTKALSGRTLADGEFTFDLMEGAVLIESVSNLGTSIPFAAINYTLADVGEHTYTISEQASGLGGVTDDTLEVTYIVTVSDNGDGTLDVAYDTPEDTIFNNHYEAEDTTAAISLSKMLTGRDLKEGEFSFELYNADSEGVLGTLVETVMNVGTAVDFSPITYTDDDLTVADNSKTYYYIVKETLYTTLGGITYDGDEKKINVVVTDNGLGQMEATVNYPDDTTFNNEYDIQDKTIILTGTKMFTGIKELTDGLFSFEVLEGTTVVATGLNKADGSIDFTPITYKTANIGTHTYLIREVPGTGGGIGYDTMEYTVTVVVADNGDGTLKIDISYPETGAVFTNTYTTEDTSLVLEATKTLTGDKLLEDQEFSFEVYEGTTLVTTGKNAADGKISFAPIVFSESHIGVHNYTVKEVNTGLEGVTFDAHEFAVEVTVVDNGDGTLTATAKYPEGGIHFTNNFTPLPITHNVPVEKRVTGAGAPTDAKFYFELKAITPEAPMPAGAVNGLKTYTMTGAGSFELGLMSFTKEGTYVYELREQPTDAKNFTIDTTLYTITIKITREGYKLVKAAVFTMNNGTEPLEKLVYTNTYKAPPPPIPRTGEQTRSLLLYGLGLLAAALALFAYKKRRDKHHKAL